MGFIAGFASYPNTLYFLKELSHNQFFKINVVVASARKTVIVAIRFGSTPNGYLCQSNNCLNNNQFSFIETIKGPCLQDLTKPVQSAPSNQIQGTSSLNNCADRILVVHYCLVFYYTAAATIHYWPIIGNCVVGCIVQLILKEKLADSSLLWYHADNFKAR